MAKTPKEKPLKPMIEGLNDLKTADGTIKGLAFQALRLDLRQVRTEREFREAFSGLSALNQLLAPVHRSYAVAIEGMRKNLESYHRVNHWLLPDEAMKRLEASWRAICEVFRKHLPAETWEGIEQTTVEAFSDVRAIINRSKS